MNENRRWWVKMTARMKIRMKIKIARNRTRRHRSPNASIWCTLGILRKDKEAPNMIFRREFIIGALSAGVVRSAPRPPGVLIDSHVHLFADDNARFPLSPLSYKPKPNPVG